MAKLTGKEGLLTIEFKLLGIRDGWIEYEVLLFWQGKPIINSDVLKCRYPHWYARTPGALTVSQGCDHDEDLVQMIEGVLETGEKGDWLPMEPDVGVVIVRSKYGGGFDLTVSADVNAFVGCPCHTGDKISLTMGVGREELADFCEQLKKERGELVCAYCKEKNDESV